MNHLIMTRKVYEGVTTMPHFPTSIDYEGCHVEFEDIYFNQPEILLERINQLEKTRKGTIFLDGGSRFQLTIEADVHGGISISFRASPITNPGTLILGGSFVFDGEHAAPIIKKFNDLFGKGEELHIAQELWPGF